jgi:tetratricopeptide (TPR) repeat protein
LERSFYKAALLLVCLCLSSSACPARAADGFPSAIKIVAPDGRSTKIYSRPDIRSEMLDTAFHNEILEVIGFKDGFVEVRLPEKKVPGFVLKADTAPFETPAKEAGFPVWIPLTILAILALGAGAFVWWRSRNKKEVAQHAAAISLSIKKAEDFFRSGDYMPAIREFNRYVSLQGGELRNPDVHRRLAVCYQKIGDINEAARAWEKMRSLGGIKSVDDHALGVELMIALGREAEAAEIYERLLEGESSEEKCQDIHKKLFELYRRLKEPAKVISHAAELIAMNDNQSEVVIQTVNLLMEERRTDLALEANHKDLIKAICAEFMEEKNMSAEAARIYLKCLEYDRTDQGLHRLLSEIYAQAGDFRRAVSELTILHQLDKEQSDQYMERAARLYVENAKVQDALTEGNPLIIKKIAQIFLARSEVNPDAVATYERVLEFQPKAVGINKMLSTVYLTRGDLDKYMAKLRLLHEIDGSNQDYLSDLAQCVIDNDLIDETIREGNRDLNSKILKQLIKRGVHNDKAVALFEKLLKFESSNVLIRRALANAYERRGELDKALDQFLALVQLRPDDEELIEKVSTMAVELDLLEKIGECGHGKLLAATALKAVERGCDGPECRKLLERVMANNPSEMRVRSYLSAMPGPSAPPPETAPLRDASPTPAPEPSTPSVSPEPAKPRKEPKAATKKVKTKPLKKEAPAAASVPTPPLPVPEPPETISDPMHRAPEQAAPVQEPATAPTPEHPSPPEPRPSQAEARAQFVQLTDASIPFEEKAITTFVSGYDQRKMSQYRPEELFFPAAGGLAYKDLDVLSVDGWGGFFVGVEVNTGRRVLMRIFSKELLDFSLMKDFVEQVSEVGFNMNHDAILPVEDAVTAADRRVAFVHPFCPQTLEQAVATAGLLDLDRMLSLVEKIIDAVAFAHHYKGVDGKLRRTYHLHLQPSQVLVDQNMTECKIAGFGYSQIYRNLTRAGKARWLEPAMNPATMPPEFFRSRSGSVKERAADVYSLGVLIHWAVTGEYPFEGPTLEDFKFQHTKIFAAPPRLINPSVPDWLEPIILGCLEKDPSQRWSSVSEIRQAFDSGNRST